MSSFLQCMRSVFKNQRNYLKSSFYIVTSISTLDTVLFMRRKMCLSLASPEGKLGLLSTGDQTYLFLTEKNYFLLLQVLVCCQGETGPLQWPPHYVFGGLKYATRKPVLYLDSNIPM